jgi:type I restriction-modification system DNA methylase subunit
LHFFLNDVTISRCSESSPRSAISDDNQVFILGEIVKNARPEIQNPAPMEKMFVILIIEENTSAMQADVKVDIYEGLLSKNAAESPKGTGPFGPH